MISIWDLSTEQRIHLFAEHSLDYGFIILDPEGRIVEWSTGAQHLLGWSAQEAIHQSHSIVFSSEDQNAGLPYEELEHAIKQDFSSDERWHSCKDGSRIFAGCVTRPIYDSKNVLIGFGKVIRDLTQRKVALDRVAQQARLLDLSYDAVLIWNLQNGRILYWNKVAQDRYGFSLEEATGSNSHALLATRFPERWEDIKASLLTNRLWEGILTHTAKSGKQIHVESRMMLRPDLAEEEIVLETNRDITYQKETAEALRLSEERFRTLVTATSQVVWTTDPDGYIKEDSPSWREYTGQAYEEYKETGWVNALHPDDRKLAANTWTQCVADKCLYQMEYRIRRHDGQYRWSLARGVPLLNADGTIREWMGANVDITERKQAEIERQRFVLLARYSTEFIGMADINLTPLFINPAGMALVGLESEEEALQLRIENFFFPEDRAFILDEFLPKAIREGAGETEVRFRHFKTHEPIWVIYSVFALHDEKGKPVGHATISRNITERMRMVQELRDARMRLESTLEAAEVATWIWNIQENRLIPDRNLIKLFSLPEEDIKGAPIEKYFANIHEGDTEYINALIRHVIRTGEPFQPTFRIRTPSGEYHWVIGRGKVTYDDKKNPVSLCGVVLDITRQKQAEEALRISNERLNLAIEGAGEGIWEWDVPSDLVNYSSHIKEMTGFSEDELGHDLKSWLALIHPEDLPRSNDAMLDHLNGKVTSYSCEYRVRCKSGKWKWIHSRGVLVERTEQGRPLRVVGIIGDIHARKESEERIWRLANFDSLSGLPNRRLFRDRFSHEILNAARRHTFVALLFIDLDRFKQVNDLLGHDAGDLLLIEAAKRVKECVRDNDTVARLGGDEFTIILADLQQNNHIEHVAQKVLNKLSAPFRLGTEKVFLSGSIGIAVYPQDGETPEDLIRKADQAMYAAKHAGKNQFSYFTKEMDKDAHVRLRLIHALHHAIQAKQIGVFYQPVIDLKSERVVKAEALIRWTHPIFGNISPAQFIPLAEEAGMISALGDYVFKEAAKKLKHWEETFNISLQISINKSPLQFKTKEGDKWLSYLKKLGVPPNCIVVEITEGALLDFSEEVSHELFQYRDAGIQVAIDDFGTGYSSMSYLQKFDIDYLKIDQSFVKGMETNAGNRTIAESIIVMAHKLGLQVIAEGIENQTQMEMLREAGCDYGQGYLFSKPLPVHEFEDMLIKRHRGIKLGSFN